MTTVVTEVATAQPRGRLRAVTETAVDHPVATAFVVALALRLTFALVSFLVNHPLLLPDEGNYLSLGAWVAKGHTADSWQPSYGQSLYDATWAFTAPIVQMFKLFGASRIYGQLLAVLFGALATALAATVAIRYLGRRSGLLVGLAMATLPSQVLFSSVAIRESMVWVGLLLMALGLTYLGDERTKVVVGGFAMAVGGLWLLGLLRDQTAVAAAWAFALALLVLPCRRRAVWVAGGVAAMLLVPQLTGSGLGGWALIEHAVPSLARVRAVNSVDAESAFQEPDVVTTLPSGGPTTTTTPTTAPTTVTTQDQREFVRSGGQVYRVEDETVGNSLRAMPRGLVATVFRPFPWESGASVGANLARVENLGWYGLYALALLGGVALRRRLREFAFPIFLGVGVVLAAAVSQGNVGTAFRHRGQVLWVVLLFAVAGALHLWDRRTAKAAPAR